MTPRTEYPARVADLVVVGGGLAGLTAAALVARAGRTVVVLEGSKAIGGRAATQARDGIHWNLGPHALYCRGHAFRILRDLGVPFTGRFPDPGRGLLVEGESLFPLPSGAGSLIATGMLSIREKWRLARFLSGLGRLDTRRQDEIPLRDWIRQAAGEGRLAALLRTLIRVSTYADDQERLSAGVALDQLRTALTGNVWYLDGGWQTLVDGLREKAAGWGAEIRTSAGAESVAAGAGGVSVRIAGGETVRGARAIVAVGPAEACDLLLDLAPGSGPPGWASGRIPVRAACLDLALDRLPRPMNRVAFGLDRPLYFSVHSASARLAPDGVAVAHAMKYLGGGDEPSPSDARAELEAWLDRVQPGWRAHVIKSRFLPSMTVAHALPTAEGRGLAGRPPVEVPGRPGVYVAGDWVGGRGLLADASAASAEEAAGRVIEDLSLAAARPSRRLSHA
ncbi:Putrescine oxidase [Aquisphaera giovannonii]|uniref:Putrescine oxidase n=1 Tax=Aquisphaera giovannonii TaxID=406548 RepID=A0A5B9WDP9_9BACT|nr:FAD-dependent oxidoreductase [Aquisphaera giovannonii]QEH38020.1 Putrescine oxidase [Aquisphaera giovannonii]